MATEICKKCGSYATPWHWVEELKGHICIECAYGWLDSLEGESNNEEI